MSEAMQVPSVYLAQRLTEGIRSLSRTWPGPVVPEPYRAWATHPLHPELQAPAALLWVMDPRQGTVISGDLADHCMPAGTDGQGRALHRCVLRSQMGRADGVEVTLYGRLLTECLGPILFLGHDSPWSPVPLRPVSAIGIDA